MADKTKDLATQEEAGGLAILPDRQAVYDLLHGSMIGTTDLMENYDSEEVQRALALGLLGSESLEELYGTQALEPWSELIGRPMEVKDVHFNPSKTEKGPGFYAVVNLVDLETGEAMTRHIGGWRPMAQLLATWAAGKVPFRAKVIEVGIARQGQSAPLGLELV
jgi:hypothetical protein